MKLMAKRRRALLSYVQSAASPLGPGWHATISSAALDGIGRITVDGTTDSYTATYTFTHPGNYRLYVIGKGGNGGKGGNSETYNPSASSAQKAGASGGSGGSGGYGGCALFDMYAVSGETITITYNASQTIVNAKGQQIIAKCGTKGGDGTNGNTERDPSNPLSAIATGGVAGTKGNGGTSSGSNVEDGNITGVDGNNGANGTGKIGINVSIPRTNGANTNVMNVNFMKGGAAVGGGTSSKNGASGVYSMTGGNTVLGNPGAGGAGGLAKVEGGVATSEKGGSGGTGGAGGVVLERTDPLPDDDLDSEVRKIGITYTGTYTDEIKKIDGENYRLLTLTKSGTLTLEKPLKCDIWIIGGGSDASDPPEDYSALSGNGGGAGGYSEYLQNASIKSLNVFIGAAQGATYIRGDASLLADSNMYSVEGGTGGGTSCDHIGKYLTVESKGDGKSKHPFESADMPPVGGGGGEGGHVIRTWNVSMYEITYYNGGAGGSDGQPGGECQEVINYPCKGGAGGAGGGGNGGDCTGAAVSLCTQGENGKMYGAGGGQNGWYAEEDSRWPGYYDYYSTGGWGHGYQGAAFIRFPLKQK